MIADHCFILAAGKGTRMGELGKTLPKPLWPVLDQTILDLQIKYAKMIGVKSIYINIHHCAEQIEDYLKNNHPDIKILFEPNLLDVGGAIHNLASRPEIQYSGSLLILNSDQFFLLDEKKWMELSNRFRQYDHVLTAVKVKAKSGYGGILLKDEVYAGLCEPSHDHDYFTYSGMSLISLDRLKPATGVSKFFKTVINNDHNLIGVVDFSDCEYWDFGTYDRYQKSIFALHENGENFHRVFETKVLSDVEDKNYQFPLGRLRVNLENKSIVIDLN